MNSFYQLNPDLIMQATESVGLQPTGEFRQLNSYENRVFDLALEDQSRVIVKFYRPNRWTSECILEEHLFLRQLSDEGFPAVAAMTLPDAEKSVQVPSPMNRHNLFSFAGMYFSFFPKKMARMPDEILPMDLALVGRKLAELHRIGAQAHFEHRPVFGEDLFDNQDLVLRNVIPEMRPRYEQVLQSLQPEVEDLLDGFRQQRIHGDIHRGNLLHDGKEFFFVDFDDCQTGPTFQDIWMLWLSLENEEDQQTFIQGYEDLAKFPHDQIEYVRIFQALRLVSYSAWILRRWQDPSFPALFPEFGTYNYWAQETESLEKCLNDFQRRS